MSNSNIFEQLTTERLLLRQFVPTDDQAIFRIRSNKKVYKYIAKKNKGIANGEFMYWAITLKESQELVGTICLWNFSKDRLIAEVGYELYPDYHKKGIMNEALQSVVLFGFEDLNLNNIEGFTHKENEASKALLVKRKFVLDTNRKDEGFPNNIIYTLSK